MGPFFWDEKCLISPPSFFGCYIYTDTFSEILEYLFIYLLLADPRDTCPPWTAALLADWLCRIVAPMSSGRTLLHPSCVFIHLLNVGGPLFCTLMSDLYNHCFVLDSTHLRYRII